MNNFELNNNGQIYENNTIKKGKVGVNELNFNKINKEDIKDIFRKTNYYELSKNNMINHIKNNNNENNSNTNSNINNNKIINKQANILSSQQLKKDTVYSSSNSIINSVLKSSPYKNEGININEDKTEKKNNENNLTNLDESDDDKFFNNYKKNRTVFRKKKKINYDDNIDINNFNNSTINNKIEENIIGEINGSMNSLNNKEK